MKHEEKIKKEATLARAEKDKLMASSFSKLAEETPGHSSSRGQESLLGGKRGRREVEELEELHELERNHLMERGYPRTHIKLRVSIDSWELI